MRVYRQVECRQQRDCKRCIPCRSVIKDRFICLRIDPAMSNSGYEHLFHATHGIKDIIPYSRLLQSTAV